MVTPVRTTARARFDRMLAKSEEQTRVGNLPRLLRSLPARPNGDLVQIWSVGSRTVAGEIHIVEVTQPGDGRAPLITCDCPAMEYCWHLMHVLRAMNGEVPFYRTPERPLDVTRHLAGSVLPMLSTQEFLGVVCA